MPDLSAGRDYPNPYNLFASDFGYDDTAYVSALGFLGDLQSGTDHDEALKINGGDRAMLRAWQGSDKFRRVYAKCRAAGVVEQEALRRAEEASAATEGEGTTNPQGQTFVALEDFPARQSVFTMQPNRASWGEA